MPVAGGAPSTLGRQIAEVIASDLRSTGLFTPLGPNGIGSYTHRPGEQPRPMANGAVPARRSSSPGTVEPRGDGRITVGCYVHDVAAGRELARQGFAVAAADWRRAAHKCADTIYSRLSGQQAFLDTRIVYVAETGPKNTRLKRIAIMDSDGSNHRYLTSGAGDRRHPALLARAATSWST